LHAYWKQLVATPTRFLETLLYVPIPDNYLETACTEAGPIKLLEISSQLGGSLEYLLEITWRDGPAYLLEQKVLLITWKKHVASPTNHLETVCR
jgi:hypothetical protein